MFIALVFVRPLACPAAEEEADPTEPRSSLVPLERADQPLDMVAPPSQFSVPDGDELWKRTWQRVTNPPNEGGGYFDLGGMLGEFVSARKFHAEFYAPGENGEELQIVLAADEAVKDGNRIVLTRMRVIHFVSENPIGMPKKPKGDDKKKAKGDKADKPKPKLKAGPRNESALSQAMTGGRMVITAPKAVIDLTTNEGSATGNVTIEIFGRFDPDKKDSDKPFAVLSSEKLNWRTWSDPSIGSNELALYTVADKKGDPEPLVKGHYRMTQADGTETSMLIQGRGMVYETGTLDRLNPAYDEDGRTAGLSKVARNRVMFRKDIEVSIVGTTLFAPPIPFSGPMGGDGLAETVQMDRKRRKEQPPVAPAKTVITCGGPGMIDLACVPKVQRSASEAVPPTGGAAAQGVANLKPIALARKFEFLNGVSMDRDALDGAPVPAGSEPVTKKHMACKHLRIVYPPGSLPSTASFPEYAEAIGGVKMNGMMTPPSGGATAEAAPFDVSCQRMYFDGPRDNMFLVGSSKEPVTVVSPQIDLRAQQVGYRSRTQTFTMPSAGPKRMVIHAAALAPSKAPEGPNKAEVFNFAAGGDTIVEWNGPMFREIKRLPVPHQPDRVKEVLTIKDAVKIEQPHGGLRMMGKVIRLVRSLPGGEVEFLQGDGGMDVVMGDLQATGDSVSVDMKYGNSGETIKNQITVSGSRKNEIKATLFMGGSAVRADKFIIDRKSDTFRALGGALAIVKAKDEKAEKTLERPDAAKDAGALFKGISFKPGGNLMLQCDGEFSQDGATRTVTVRKNVLIRQTGMQMIADEVAIELDQPAQPLSEAATPAKELFSGDLKSITCSGNVELSTPDQLVHCDQLIHNVKEDSSLLQMSDPENDVRIYAREESGGTRFLSVQKSLKLDGQSGKFTPGGMLLMLPYRSDRSAP
ncbi:MAG TPA: hypothetical protein VEJ63_16570, partial [Planctomycetota bacterium]|nr:hypothetical protein [Planctomycetota bacterium]